MKLTHYLLNLRWTRHAAFGFLAVGLPLATPSPTIADDARLDTNDVSFLWPVPKTAADVAALISLADEAADGPIMPPALFKALMETAKKVSVDGVPIRFPNNAFDDPKTWKVAGIRINPTALGSNPQMVAMAEVPGIRVIVQPVLVSGGDALPQDFTAHVVFNYILPPQPNQPVKPDKEAFGRIVQDLRQLKKDLNLPASTESSQLNVHPGFSPDPAVLTAKLKALLKKHLSSKNLDKSQKAAVSFMGIPGAFEPWIFFKVVLDVTAETAEQVPVSGRFEPAKPFSQMVSFTPDTNGKVVPAPLAPQNITDASTAGLFPIVPPSRLEEPLFPGTTNPKLTRWQLRDVPDVVAHPQITTTLTTDCVSCHTESTRRHLTPGLKSQSGTAFALPAGISGVSPEVLPKDRWNLRNFGWGFNFDGAADSLKGFQPTVSQRAANEAAESADFINKNYPNQQP
jgi:hypothetical protein